jgi:hypothetical protein
MAATATLNLNDIAVQWREARRMYPIYSALVRQHRLGDPCTALESPINRADPEVLHRIDQWFDAADQKIEAWQLRQLLQTTQLGNDDNLRALIKRHLERAGHAKPTTHLRDKVDYLLVQYYAHCAPHNAHAQKPAPQQVAEVLQHAIGKISERAPDFARALDAILGELDACQGLGDLLQKRIVERAREIKESTGVAYFEPAALVTFARFNFLLRLGFFRLMHSDLHAVRLALHAMEGRGQQACDCTSAGLSSQEAFSSIREICQNWKKPFRADYSPASNFRELIAIRAAVEGALNMRVPQSPAPSFAMAAEISARRFTAEDQVISRPPSQGPVGLLISLEECLAKIAEQLPNAKVSPAVTAIMLGKSKLMLASWEVAALVRGGNDVALALQRAVAARAVLQIGAERQKAGEKVDFSAAIGAAHAEAAQMQEQIARAKDAKNIDAAVNLAATQKRLLAAIAETEKK